MRYICETLCNFATEKEQTHDATQKIRCPQGTRHIVQRHGVRYGNSVSLCFIGRLSPCQVSKGYTCRKKEEVNIVTNI